jgi:hypothetical protein
LLDYFSNYDRPKLDESTIQCHVEAIRNVVEGGLPKSLLTESTIYFKHSVFRKLFDGKGKFVVRDTRAFIIFNYSHS